MQDKEIGKQIGCMAGFFQIFDRNQILAGKRLHSAKRLASTPANESTPESERRNDGSPAVSREVEKQIQQQQGRSAPSPERFKQSPAPLPEIRSPASGFSTPVDNNPPPPKSPLPLPIFELKEGTRSPWKFSKEAPRLSLDSRAVVDAKGSLKPREIRTNAGILSTNRCENNADDGDNNRRSPGVIARLMGLEPAAGGGGAAGSDPEPAKKAELRRSASESRVSRDLLQYRFIDGVNFQLKQNPQSNFQSNISGNPIRENGAKQDQVTTRSGGSRDYNMRNARGEPAKAPYRVIGQRKCFYDSADFFPEPKQTVSIYGEIEKRLKLRGIDEPSKDLETLKQILEALQLKGLLHSKKPSNSRNIVYDRSFAQDESPIVVMRPSRLPVLARRQGNDSPPSYRSRTGTGRNSNNSGDSLPLNSPRNDRNNARNRNAGGRNAISPTRSESSLRSPSKRPLTVETKRRGNEPMEQRRTSPVQSPKVTPRRIVSDQVNNRSRINRKPEKIFIPVEDEFSTVSESTNSTSSPTNPERLKVEEYKEGKVLLERCGKLLNSIAEITATDLQPSPVSVLDSSFYKEESPSPIMKRSIDFKDQFIESEDEVWSLLSSESKSEDCDFIYISDVIRAANFFPEDSDVFILLEKQQYLKWKDTSKASTLQRRLIFDTITEILNRKRQLPPWKVSSTEVSLQQVWSEFQRIRERDISDDLFETICGVLKKDLAGDTINGWVECPVEMSETVLDIERLIFKDLIGETIRDLASFGGQCNKIPVTLCRKLVF